MIGLGLYGQSYEVDLFEKKKKVSLDIWTYGAWQPTDSTHIKASISKLDSIFIFRLNSITSNQIILWSEKEIKKSAFPFYINTQNDVKIIESDKYEQMMNDLRKDVKIRMDMTDEDLEEMEGYQNFLFSPGVMYEAYHQPYIEILKHFISKKIKNENVDVWEPDFNDSIPANLITTYTVENQRLLTHHVLQQDEIAVCNFKFDKEIKEYKEKGKDAAWYAKTFKRDECPYMHTDYEFNSELIKEGELFSPIKISYERRKPSPVKIEILINE